MKILMAVALFAMAAYAYNAHVQMQAAQQQIAFLLEERTQFHSQGWFSQRMEERPALEPPNSNYRKPDRYDDEARRRGLDTSSLNLPAHK